MAIEFIDKRGKKTEPVVEQSEATVPAEDLDKATWKTYTFIVTMLRQQNGTIQAGKVIGIRGDDRLFSLDIPFAPVWSEGWDWTAIAKKRLDTYLGCECNEYGMCNLHTLLQSEWFREDSTRLTDIMQGVLPEALTKFIEQANALEALSKGIDPATRTPQ